MTNRKILWLILFAFILTMFLGFYFRPVVKEGVVAAKSITGEQDGAVHTIIRFNEAGRQCHIYDCEILFPSVVYKILPNVSNPSVESPMPSVESPMAIEFGKCNASDIKIEKIQSTKLSDYAESQLKTRYSYSDLRCIINVRTKSKTMGYYASKDDFNKVDPGDAMKFKILRKRDPTIKIIKVTDEEAK